MPNLDDEQFERYLRQFRPLDPEPLAFPHRRRATPRSFTAAVWALSGAIVSIAALLIAHLQPAPVPAHSASNPVAVEHTASPRPLTLSTANALLARSETMKAALDEIAFPSPTNQLPEGKQSALAALSQDINKL